MPRVPRLQGPSVSPRGLPAPQVSPENVGAPIARAVGAVGGELARVVQEERAKVARVQSNEAEVALRRVRDQLLYDPDKGALTRQRTQVTGAPEAFGTAFDQEASRIEATIRDPEARQLFQNRVRALRAEADSMILRHADSELDKAQVELTDALVADEVAKVERMPMDAAAIDAALTTATGLRRQLLQDRGVDERLIERDIANLTSQARVRQIGALLQSGVMGATDRALSLYEDIKDDVTDPRQRDQLDKVIGQVRVDREVNRLAADILAATDDPVARNERIAAIADPTVRKGVRDIVRGEQNAQKEAEDLRREQSFERLEAFVQQGGRLTDPRVAADVAVLSVSQRETLEKFTSAPTTDNAAWMEWYQLSLDPTNLAKMSESEFRSYWVRLSTNHRDDAERDYRKAKETANAPDEAKSYITPQTIIARAMRNLGGVDPFAALSTIDPKKQPLVAQFELRASEEIAAERRAKGRDLTPREVQEVVDRMQLQYVRETAGVGFNPIAPARPRITREREELRGFQMTPSDTTGIFAGSTRIRLASIPADALPAVDNILRTNNVPVTERNREALYTIQQFDLDGSRVMRWLNDNRR